MFQLPYDHVMTMNAYLVVWFQIVGINIYIKIRDDLFIVLTVHVMVAENLSYVLSFIWACVSKSIRFWIFLRILFQVRTDVKLDTFIVHGFVVISFCIRWISKMKAMVNNLRIVIFYTCVLNKPHVLKPGTNAYFILIFQNKFK